MNAGWAFTLIGFVYVLLIVVVFWVMEKGMGWRREAEDKKAKDKEAV
jgi:hypothetical protein